MDKVYTYDLTYTITLNREDEAQKRSIWDYAHFVCSLQGLVNRRHPRLYIYFVGDEHGDVDHYWMEKMREPGGWLQNTEIVELDTLEKLIKEFRTDFRGLVVYDERVPATSNVASTIAGAENLACVRYDETDGSLCHWLVCDETGPKLPVVVSLMDEDGGLKFTGSGLLPDTYTKSSGSAKCDAYLWAKEKYLDTEKCNPKKLGYYIDAYWITEPGGRVQNHTLSNHDYFIAQKGFFFDLSFWDSEVPVDDPEQPLGTDYETARAILRSCYDLTEGEEFVHTGGFTPWDKKYTQHAGGSHHGVATEWRQVEVQSCYNSYLDADALGYSAMANASFFMHYPLEEKYPQKKPTIDDLKTKGFITKSGEVDRKVYITFYVGDYDSSAWLYQSMPKLWDDPARGEVPLGWAFNPNLADRFPVGMAHARKTKTENDFFVAGDTGAGYVNPGHLEEPRQFSGLHSGVDAWEKHCRPYYERWDLSITGFIIDGFAPGMSEESLDAYSRFSPDGIVAQKIDKAGVYNEMPFVRMWADLNNAEQGTAKIVEDVATSKLPGFFMYRTILWSPTRHRELIEEVKAADTENIVEIVDPYTFMLLVKEVYGE